jgi:hypothetical protein
VYPLHGRGEYFFTPVRIRDKAFIAKVTLKETKIAGDSNPLYTVEAVTFDEVIRPAVSWVDASAAADGIDLTSNRPTRLVKIIADSVQKYNDAEVSKIVDANGEPLVVYHGTNADFYSFNEGVNYFSPRQEYGHVQNSDVEMRVFLNIKNPEFVNRVGMIESLPDNIVSEIKGNGFDGVVYANKSDLMQGVTGWGNDKPQIATFTVNTFATKREKKSLEILNRFIRRLTRSNISGIRRL